MLDKIKALAPLNFALLSNPYNWAVIVLMVAFGGLALGLIFHPSQFSLRASTDAET